MHRSRFGLHFLQLCFKHFAHLLARRQSGGSGALCIVPGLAVQAVKSADLAIVRHQVNTERYAETSAMYRPEYSGME